MDSNWIVAAEPVRLAFNGWLFAVTWLFVLWLVECLKEDAGVIDLGWTLGVGVLAVYYATSAAGYAPRRVLVATMASLWSFRLALYILIDRLFKEQEDGRYQDLRAYWGGGWGAHRRFLWFFEAQSLLVVLFSLPMLVLVQNPRASLSAWEIAGVLVWLVSVAGESVADRQLARFRADPSSAGRVCRAGLWRYSRHPNYFFEWVHWWAYVFMGIGAPFGWLTLIGPAAMWLFLQKLTGIPATETHALKSRGEEYRAYQRSTSAFVPWFPKRA
jgi:steroid 5-alpha reductase family enzyme